MTEASTSQAWFRARDGASAELGRRLLELLARAQADGACLGCELLQEGLAEGEWLLRSHWATEAAWDAHLCLPHMQLLGQLVGSGLIRHMALRVEPRGPQPASAA